MKRALLIFVALSFGISMADENKIHVLGEEKDGSYVLVANKFDPSTGELGEERIVTWSIPYKNGKKNGVAVGKIDDEIYEEISYVNDIREGISRKYHDNGNIYCESMYRLGKKNGI